jgi:hypothetical protein
VLLADGTGLFAGGRDPIDGTLEQPLLLRFRPRLDGPDEQIPDITELAPASWVLHDAESIDANGAELRLTPVGAVQEFPAVWAHVRGFRSERFRFDVTLRATAGARVSLVLSRGAVAQTLIHFDPEEVRWVGRDTRGEAISVACEGEGLVFDAGRTLRFDVSPEGISVRTGNDLVAKCPGTDEGLVAVGLGASGGELVASGFRLSRR